ncbi:LacI family DNA-binding transcriptional regulator [Paenibacillus filicis]|uniref:LacI family DNA-binding transcriptional regulator n=1 Tax=Paenibacillus filicis TaxID=669464 RepID=A0ABU9DJJ7_9BACL
MNPTIHDVAKKAMVSISTVSRVVNHPQSVAPEKREKVLRVIRELGYEPNPFASGLRDRRTRTIAAIIPDITNPFYAELFRGIEDVARAQKNNVMICNTDQDESRFLEYMSYFQKKRIDGLIFVSSPVTETYREAFEDLRVPVVLAATDSEAGGWPSVTVDNYRAGYDAAMFLIKNGHEAIGMISGPLEDPIAGSPRYEGFQAALLEAGLTLTQDRVALGAYDFDSGYEAMRSLFGRSPDLTAVFAASDAMAVGASAFLLRRGIDVPRQVSVLGFDNLQLARMVTPALTTVAQPVYRMGHEAAAMLFRTLDHPLMPQESLVLPHELIVRDTVGKRN